MRVLFTCLPATGHLHPLVPIARALADAGHEVAFATHASMAPLVERAGDEIRALRDRAGRALATAACARVDRFGTLLA